MGRMSEAQPPNDNDLEYGWTDEAKAEYNEYLKAQEVKYWQLRYPSEQGEVDEVR